MRLDFLQNHPSNPSANKILMDYHHPNLSPILPLEAAELAQKSQKLAQIFGGNKAYSFGFGFCDWFVLLSNISKTRQIAYAFSNHQQATKALKHLENKPKKLPLDLQSGVLEITSIKEAISQKCTCFVIPFINQDLLTINNITAIKEILQQNLKDFLLIIDISYAQSCSIAIPKILDENTIFVLDGEAVGILRGNGILIAKDFRAIEALPPVLENIKLFDAFWEAIVKSPIKMAQDTKAIFYDKLKALLKENLSLFAPLQNTLPNALALRFHSIKARVLLQALFIQEIYAINGQECLFGLSKPSFVLQEMGYSEAQARELISVSYAMMEDMEDMDMLTEALSRAYFQIRSMGI